MWNAKDSTFKKIKKEQEPTVEGPSSKKEGGPSFFTNCLYAGSRESSHVARIAGRCYVGSLNRLADLGRGGTLAGAVICRDGKIVHPADGQTVYGR